MKVENEAVSLQETFLSFQNAIVNDPRIGPTHISLYLAILHLQIVQDYVNPISVYSRELMKYAKIAGTATYCKCIQDLKQFGFINYEPSYNPLFGSLVYILDVRPAAVC